MDISSEIDLIVNKNFKKKISDELAYLIDNENINIFSNINDIDLSQRIKLLEEHQQLDHVEHDIKQIRQNLFTEIDKFIYKKQWNKLSPYHKIVKLKEYVKDTYNDGKLQDEIVKKLISYAEEGKINSKKYVIYDPSAEKILSIPVLTVDLEKETYQLKII